jgi:hypothetical protein
MGIHLSASLNRQANWNYRKTEERLVVIKTKNQEVRKAAALDSLTNLSFTIEIPENISLEGLQAEKEYLAHLKVYTSSNIVGIDAEFINFFNALDVDQNTEDFIKAYWVYPSKIRFELADFEEP